MAKGKNKTVSLNFSKVQIFKDLQNFWKNNSSMKNRFILAISDYEKLQGALSSYGSLEKNEEPVVLYDDTVFGGAKDGFLITNKNVYTHEMFAESYGKLPLSDVERITIGGTNIFFNSIRAPVSLAGDVAREAIAELLRKWIIAEESEEDSDDCLDAETDDKDVEEDEDEDSSADEITEEEEEYEYDEEDEEYDVEESDVDYDEEDDDIEESCKCEDDEIEREKFFNAKVFKGFLYTRYGINASTSLEDAVSILESDGWEQVGQSTEATEDFPFGLLAFSNNDESKLSFYGLPPCIGLELLTDDNHNYCGHSFIFNDMNFDHINNDDKAKSISTFIDLVCKSYDFNVENISSLLYCSDKKIGIAKIFLIGNSTTLMLLYLNNNFYSERFLFFLVKGILESSDRIDRIGEIEYDDEDNFLKLLKKWEEIFERKTDGLQVSVDCKKVEFGGGQKRYSLSYWQGEAHLYFYLYYVDEYAFNLPSDCSLSMSFEKNGKKIEGKVRVSINTINNKISHEIKRRLFSLEALFYYIGKPELYEKFNSFLQYHEELEQKKEEDKMNQLGNDLDAL